MPDPGIADLIAVLAVASLVVLIPALAIALGLRLARVGRDPKPEDRLRNRLARGEITRDEFDTAMSALGR